jgi:uncharacterized protein YyaL (SSP411 family)
MEHFTQLENLILTMSEKMNAYPTSYGYWLQVSDLWHQSAQQIALVSQDPRESLDPFIKIFHQRYRPHSVIVVNFDSDTQIHNLPGLLDDRSALNGKPTAYICRNFTCLNPIIDVENFKKELDQDPNHRS